METGHPSPRVSVIVPCFNEGPGIESLVGELGAYFLAHPELDAEVVFVDDGSSDDTSEQLRRAVHKGYRAKLIRLAANVGSNNAYRAGLSAVSGEYITALGADLQHPPSLVHRQMECMQEGGYHLVLAQRINTQRRSFFERSFSGLTIRFIRKYAVRNYPEDGCDVFMVSRSLATVLMKHVEPNSPVILQVLHFGYPYGVITYDKQVRSSGASKWTLSKKIKLFIDSILGFSYAPMRMVTAGGIAFFAAGVLWTIAIVLRKLILDDLVSGWALLSSLLFIGFGFTNISLGIIAEYLWRTFDAARNRPAYVIDRMEELTDVTATS